MAIRYLWRINLSSYPRVSMSLRCASSANAPPDRRIWGSASLPSGRSGRGSPSVAWVYDVVGRRPTKGVTSLLLGPKYQM